MCRCTDCWCAGVTGVSYTYTPFHRLCYCDTGAGCVDYRYFGSGGWRASVRLLVDIQWFIAVTQNTVITVNVCWASH